MKRFLSVILSLALLLALAVPSLAFNKSRRSTQNLMVNGKPVSCEKYNIDGSNYFMLRDLAKLLNGTESQFDVGWDPAKRLVTLTTNSPYTTERGDELQVGEDQSATTVDSSDGIVIDGVVRSDLQAYKIGGSNFFKLRDLGDALGFDVDYIEKTRTATVASRSSIEVTDLCNVAGQYIEDGGYIYNYSFVLPKISGLDTAYIRSVNAEMQGLYDSYVSETLWQMAEDNSLTRFCISYSYTVKNGVHSLLVTADSDWDMNEYRCYHFDALGNELDNAAVLAAAGWTADDFLQRARAYLKERTDISAYFVDDGWKQYQEQTLSPGNLNADIPMVILPDGELCFVCTVYTPAGAGEYDEAFALAEDGTVSEARVGSTLLDRLRGCYLAQEAGADEATLYELVTIGDTLMLEVTDLGVNDGEYDVYSYSAIELFPEDPAALYRADLDSLRVRAVSYFPDVFTGTYGGDAQTLTLAVTADGIDLGGVAAKRCYRSDLALSDGIPETDYEKFSYDDAEALGAMGVWAGTYRDDDWQVHSLTLELTSWGELRLRDCAPDEIPAVYEGSYYIAGADDDIAPAGGVVFQLARRGGYKMPLMGWCSLLADDDGTLRIHEEQDSYQHLTKCNEYAEAVVLHRVPSIRRVVTPTVRRIAENERVYADIAADGTPEEISYAFGRDAEYGNEISSVTVTVEGQEFVIDSLFAYSADVYLVTTGMSGTAWLYIDGLSDNDYHYVTVIGIRLGDVWWAGEFSGGFTAALTDPENMEIQSRFHLVSTLNGKRAYRVGLSGYPEPVGSFYRIESDLVLKSKAELDGWLVDANGGLEASMTIPAGTALKPIRTDGAATTDLQLPDGSVCRVWSSGPMGTIGGIDVFDAFENAFFAG